MPRIKTGGLALAIALVSNSAFALSLAQDEELGDATGQDGITLAITLPNSGLSFSTIIHDAGGITGTAFTSPGALIIGDPRNAGGSYVKTSLDMANGTEIHLNIDATGDIQPASAGTFEAAVRINVDLKSALTINTGTLSVAKSNGLGVALNTVPVDQTAPFFNSMAITIGSGTLMDVYLGNEPTGGHMIDINTTLSGGLNIANFSLNDTGGTVSGGSISATNIKMCDTSILNTCTVTNQLQVKANVDLQSTTAAPVAPAVATDGGLILTLAQVGTTSGMDIELTGVKLGSGNTPVIGNIDVVGLRLGDNATEVTKIRILGH